MEDREFRPKRLVAIDTASELGQVALFVDGKLVHEESRRLSNAHGEALLPLLSNVLDHAGARAEDVDAWAVDVGPGSFTGVRVGISTVTGIVLGRPAPAFGVTSIDALIGHEGIGSVHPNAIRVGVLPSVRGEVFLGARDGKGHELLAPRAVLVTEIRAALESLTSEQAGSEIVLVGATGVALAERAELTRYAFLTAPPHDVPRATVTGELVLRGLGRELRPLYVKPPAIHPGALRTPNP